MPAPYYPGGNEVPVTDTREFLKTDYYAQMRTRDVMQTIEPSYKPGARSGR